MPQPDDDTHRTSDAVATALATVARVGRRAGIEARAAVEMRRAGILGGGTLTETRSSLTALSKLGQLGAAGVTAGIRHGDRVGLIDELGSLTFAELDARAGALACALMDRGVTGEDTIGILCRNHRGFIDITFAAAKLGARALYLNTDFGGPQLRDVCAREGVSLLVHDEEYLDFVGEVPTRHGTVLAWQDDPGTAAGPNTLEALIASAPGRTPPYPEHHTKIVLLTSGTTGTPKGAPRSASRSLAPIGALLSKVPYRSAEATFVAPPMFHGVGYTQSLLSISLGSTVITRRRFSAEHTLQALTDHRPTGLVVVPVMLRRIVTLLEQEPDRFDVSSLRIVFVSGSQLEAELVRRARRVLGEVLYNFYGSTEVAYATFATPEDLREAPGCAGRVPFGASVRLYDEDGVRVDAPDRTGRIFVGNTFQFDGYTGGGTKEMIDGLMSTGDIGHFDAAGRLWVDGRDDDMIVSGGENLFPGEVEELLVTHPQIDEAAVIGVDDEEFGKRLVAFVVPRGGVTGSDAEEPATDELTADAVKAFVRQNLARFKVPREVHFIDELPRNPSGKVLKRELRERYAEATAS